MIIQEKSPVSPKNKYSFGELKVGECNVLNDIAYNKKDLAKIRSSAYSYVNYHNLIGKVEFKVILDIQVIKIYRTK